MAMDVMDRTCLLYTSLLSATQKGEKKRSHECLNSRLISSERVHKEQTPVGPPARVCCQAWRGRGHSDDDMERRAST